MAGTNQPSTLQANYTAGSVAELADAIEARADEIEAMAVGARLKREALRFRAQAGGMRMAARMVRNTTIGE
jgi:hypothetical protein